MIQNIGQIAGLWIGNTAPENNKLIWFDTGNNLHKSYNFGLGVWTQMTMNPIVQKTYSELQSLAAHNNISQGTFYLITNLGYLALAITSTRIQYTDNNNNVIIDDLISSKTYCVTSENLLIEDKGGVWDISTNTLRFNFEETDINAENTDVTKEDYLLGTKQRSGVKYLSKYKLGKLVSQVSNNAIIWNKGFYLNFLTNLQSYYDQNGGVVRYNTYVAAINNIGLILNQIQADIANLNIWNKTLPNTFSPQTNPSDISIGDSLKIIIDKIQGWVNKFKEMNKLPNDWVPSSDSSDPTIQAGQTFPQAFSKVQRWLNLFWNISESSFTSRAVANDHLIKVFNFTVSGTSGEMSGQFSINHKDSTTLIRAGQINSTDLTDRNIIFTPSGIRHNSFISNKFLFYPDNITNNGVDGVASIDFYTMYIEKPNISGISPLTSFQKIIPKNIYALYAESLKTICRSSPVKIINSLPYDINENYTSTYEITSVTEEHIMFFKGTTLNSRPNMYIQLKIESLQLGQHIGITFFNTTQNSTDTGISLIQNDAGNAILIPGLSNPSVLPMIGSTSFSVKSNFEYKFVAVNPDELGYHGINGYLLLCLNYPTV